MWNGICRAVLPQDHFSVYSSDFQTGSSRWQVMSARIEPDSSVVLMAHGKSYLRGSKEVILRTADWISACFSHRTAEDADSRPRVMSQTFYTYEQIPLDSRGVSRSMNVKIQVDSCNICQQLIVSSPKRWFVVWPVRFGWFRAAWLKALSLLELTAFQLQNVVMINGCFNGAAFTLGRHYGNIMFEKTVINIHYNCKLLSWMLMDCLDGHAGLSSPPPPPPPPPCMLNNLSAQQ